MQPSDSFKERQEEKLEQTHPQQSGFNLKSIFKADPKIGVSKFRIYLLKIFYLMIIVLLGSEVWTEIFTPKDCGNCCRELHLVFGQPLRISDFRITASFKNDSFVMRHAWVIC